MQFPLSRVPEPRSRINIADLRLACAPKRVEIEPFQTEFFSQADLAQISISRSFHELPEIGAPAPCECRSLDNWEGRVRRLVDPESVLLLFVASPRCTERDLSRRGSSPSAIHLPSSTSSFMVSTRFAYHFAPFTIPKP